MSPQPSSSRSRQIVWPSVITVISAAILIGAEVFGAAFAGGWALAILFGLDDTGAHILQAVLFAIGVLIMVAFIRAAQRIEPFFKRACFSAPVQAPAFRAPDRAREKPLRHRRQCAHASSRKVLTSVHV